MSDDTANLANKQSNTASVLAPVSTNNISDNSENINKKYSNLINGKNYKIRFFKKLINILKFIF